MPFSRKSGTDRGFHRYSTSSLAIAIGDLLVFDHSNAVVIKATSSTSLEDVIGVCVEAIASTDTSVLVQEISPADTYVVNTTNNSNASHNYQRMVLTDQATVNNTGSDSTSDSAYVIQLSPVGAAADKKILVRFNLLMDRA